MLFQKPGESLASELGSMVGVENVRSPFPECFFQGASTQKSASRVLESLHASKYRLYQSMMTTRYRNPRSIGEYRLRPPVDSPQSHDLHQSPDMFPVDTVALTLQPGSHLAGSVERRSHVLCLSINFIRLKSSSETPNDW